MAFLDNSGDIILDAVLTKAGREAMADGDFKITRFGVGDDEINYGTYDLSHPSGSAYYDLEIMQTPIFEATTHINSEINYGLLSLGGNKEVLYMPSIKINEKDTLTREGWACGAQYDRVFFVAVNSETWEAILLEAGAGTGGMTGDKGFMLANKSGQERGIILESGLDTNLIAASSTNRTAYLDTPGLLDSSFYVDCDAKFINSVGKNTGNLSRDSDGSLNNSLSISSYVNATGTGLGNLEGHTRFSVSGMSDLIYEDSSYDIDDDTLSALRGPRGSCLLLNFGLIDELTTNASATRSRLWSDYGRTSKKLDAHLQSPTGTKYYDVIDTVVMVQGSATGATIQLPIRLLRYVSG